MYKRKAIWRAPWLHCTNGGDSILQIRNCAGKYKYIYNMTPASTNPSPPPPPPPPPHSDMGSGSFLASALARSCSLSRIIRAALVHDLDYDLPTTTAAASPTATTLAPLHKFQADLAERLEHLKGSPKTSAHLNWLSDALAVALSTQSSVRCTLIPNLVVDSRIGSVGGMQLLLQQRVDGMVGLLDVCNALKEANSDMERHLHRLHHVLQCLGEALQSSADPAMISYRMRAAGRRLSSCLDSNMVFAGDKKGSIWRSSLEEACASLLLVRRGLKARAALRNRASSTDGAATTLLLSQAMDGATLTTVLVLAAAVSSLGSSCKPTSKKYGVIGGACKNVIDEASTHTPWATPLRQLQRDLTHEEMGGAGALFQELDTLHAAAAALQRLVSAEMPAATGRRAPAAQLVLMKFAVDNLRKTSRDLQVSMATLHLQVGHLFHTLVAVRVALLDALSAGTAAGVSSMTC